MSVDMSIVKQLIKIYKQKDIDFDEFQKSINQGMEIIKTMDRLDEKEILVIKDLLKKEQKNTNRSKKKKNNTPQANNTSNNEQYQGLDVFNEENKLKEYLSYLNIEQLIKYGDIQNNQIIVKECIRMKQYLSSQQDKDVLINAYINIWKRFRTNGAIS